MLVYEKIVAGVRHLFGTHGNVPAQADAQLKYKAKDGTVLTPVDKDSYVDAFDEDGKRGIRRLSDGKFFGVFIGDDVKAIIPKDWETKAPVKVLDFIKVKKAPAKVEYDAGEALDMAGLVVSAVYKDGSSEDVPYGDKGLTFSPIEGTVVTGDWQVQIHYGGKTVEQAITFRPKPTGLAVKKQPTKITYASGEALDMAGLVITATFKDMSTLDVEYGNVELKYEPKEGSPVTASGDVVVTFRGLTVNVAITVA